MGQGARRILLYRVFYSNMDLVAEKRLDSVREKMKPEQPATMSKENFVKEMAKLYAELDYVHPFYEGNSRTLPRYESFSPSAQRKPGLFSIQKS